MAHAAGWLWKALVIPLCIVWQVLLHMNVSGGDAGFIRYALLALPLAAFAYWTVRRARNKPLWSAILVAAAVAAFFLEREGRLGLAAAYGVPHAAIYVFLLYLFGHTLLPGREALITRLARRVHGTLPPYMEAYTRRLTVAWCVFFIAQLLASGLLFAFARLVTWSMFINLLNFPLLLLMFVGEYRYRAARYRDYPHATIAQTIRAFTTDTGIKTAGTR